MKYKSNVNKTCPWNNVELKFRDGMKSLYNQDFEEKKMVPNKKARGMFETNNYSSKMCLRTEYNDFYKPFRVTAKPEKPKKERSLVNFPHTEASHY